MRWFWLGGLDQFYLSDWILLNKNERESFPASALLGGTEEAISRGGLVNPVSSNSDSRPPSPSDTAPGPGAGQLGCHYQKGAQTRRSQEKPAPSISGNIVWFIFNIWGFDISTNPDLWDPFLQFWYHIFHIGMEEQIIGSNRLLRGPQLSSYHQTANRPTYLGQEPEINSAWNAVILIRRTGSVFTHHIGSSWTRLNKNERKSSLPQLS